MDPCLHNPAEDATDLFYRENALNLYCTFFKY